jgi:hypothetical protein
MHRRASALVFLGLSTAAGVLAAAACGGSDSSPPPPTSDAAAAEEGASVEGATPSGDGATLTDAPVARDAGDAWPASDASPVGDGAQAGDGPDAADAASADSSTAPPALRVVNLVQEVGLLRSFSLNVCVAVHGSASPPPPIEYHEGYQAISPYAPLSAGAYDVWAILLGGCTPDAGSILLGDAGPIVVMPPKTMSVAGPTTLAFYRTGTQNFTPTVDFVAFSDTGTPSGQADVRMHNVTAPATNLDFFARLGGATTTELAANLAFGEASPMTALTVSDWFFYVTAPGSMNPQAETSPILAAGTWDGFAYNAFYATGTPSTTLTLVLCPESPAGATCH